MGAGLRVNYGAEPEQYGDLWAGDGIRPVVVLIHGGFWRARYRRGLMVPLAEDLYAHGCAVWVLEYRKVGDPGGGWPGTCDDVRRGLDALADLAPAHDLDLGRVVVTGHSAGGHLALWAAARPGTVVPSLAVGLAPVADLVLADELGLGGGAAAAFMGAGRAELGEAYREGSPAALLPLGVPQLIVHGARDEAVPLDMSVRYRDAADAAGDDCELVALPDADHFTLIDADGPVWAMTRDRILATL